MGGFSESCLRTFVFNGPPIMMEFLRCSEAKDEPELLQGHSFGVVNQSQITEDRQIFH
jgi:hypothetical protein